MSGYSTDPKPTTLQDVSDMLGNGGVSVLLAGDVTGRKPSEISPLIENFMKWVMVEQGLDVSTFLLNAEKKPLEAFIECEAAKYQVMLITGNAGLLTQHQIDFVLPIGILSDRLVAWAEKNGVAIWN